MSVTVEAIPQEPSPPNLDNVNQFYVPNILSFNLKKTPEDRLQAVETESLSSRQNGGPFLEPVEHTIESNQENPVLQALLRGKASPGLTQWSGVSRAPMNSCHPFKKTEFSHDLLGDDTPVQVPKSLNKKTSASFKARVKKEKSSETKMNILKEIRMNSDLSVSSASEVFFPRKTSKATMMRTQSPDKGSSDKDLCDLSIFNKRKKITSQSALMAARPRLQYVNSERLIQLRTIVDNAIKNHKVYSMTGCYNSVRNALKQRGWIEKIDNDVKGKRKINRFEEIGLYDAAFQFVQKYQTVAAMRLSMQTNSGFAHSDQIRYTGQGEAEIMNKMLKNVTEDLCWLSRPYPYYYWKDFDKFEMVNRLPRAYFSNKVGLCNSLQQIQWFYESGVCSTKFPRTYNMSTSDELEAFKEDYRLTACVGTLKWFLNAYKNGGEKAVRSPDGKVDMNVIEFALRRCAEFVKSKQHEDIDILDTPNVWEYQWDQFITQYYKIVNEGQILKDDKEGVSLKAVVSNVQSMLNILKPHCPQFDIDGYQNFWIVKPGGRCCGAGIVIKNNLEQILIMVNPNSMKETRFIVQKYIERPLLIYNTKFDIRQWFLVTNVYPLTIWMYKECYLRFCSQPFTLKNTHESIHLCNNAVQRRYKNGKRDRGLPDENMWDCYTFQTYLKAIGHPEAWDKYIYPGMKEGFIGALLASQDSMEKKKNCFELYGADFMITDTLTDGPWLIEINSNPAMDSSTSVTARLCPQVLEDIIKVVIDRRDNKSAPTGAFEMVFKQNCPPIPSYLGINLCVKGRKAFRAPSDVRSISRKSKSIKSSESVRYTDTEEESTAEEIASGSHSPVTPKSSKKKIEDKREARSCKALNPYVGKENGSKRRKIDWVKKNIADLKGCHVVKDSKPGSVSMCSKREVRDLLADEILKLLGEVEIHQFVLEMKKLARDKTEESKAMLDSEINTLIDESIEKIKRNSSDYLKHNLMESEVSETLKKLLQSKRLKATGENAGIQDLLTELEEMCRIVSKATTRSCPNFDLALEKEVEMAEEKVERTQSEDSFESYFSMRSNLSGGSSKTSLDHFRGWKSKLTETRKTCEELLAQLRAFKETNSKVKFQEVVQKRMKDELDFVQRIRQQRKSKERVRLEKEINYNSKGKERCKSEDKFWPCDEGLGPLAINSENGAVRNINYSLPKLKQRSRPPLPKGSCEHGRKIDVALEETCCH